MSDRKYQRCPISLKKARVIADLLCEDLSNKEIAARLNKTEGTVKCYVSDTLRHFGYQDRLKLVSGMLWGKIRGLEAELAELGKGGRAA